MSNTLSTTVPRLARCDDAAPMAISAEAWLDATARQSLALNFVADVTAVRDDGDFELGGSGVARQAVSCLVVPQAGDRVACWRVSDGGAEAVYILAVLSRAAGAATRLRLADGAELRAEGGQLELQATRALHLKAPLLLAQADRAELNATDGSIVARTLSTIGELVSTTVKQLRLVGATFTTAFDQQIHHAGHHRRTVDGVDRVDAQVIQQQAGTLLHLQGENLLANGERVVKMQGAQIHLG